MTTTQVVETSDTVHNSPIQDYVQPDDHTQPTYEMTPRFKPITELMVFTVTSSDCKVKKARFYEFLFTLG